MSLITTRSPVTLRHTFSFYVSAGRPEVIRRVSLSTWIGPTVLI